MDTAPKERLQPSLLDRLTDDEPGASQEAPHQRVINTSRLKQCVLRDLVWLLNSDSLDSGYDLSPYPEVQRSVLNFGIPELAGQSLSHLGVSELERRLTEAIKVFEPRISEESIRVKAAGSEQDLPPHSNALNFSIEGELGPPPLRGIYIRSQVDLETGDVTLTDRGG